MTLAEALAEWREATARDGSVSEACAESRALLLALFTAAVGPQLPLDELTPARLHDFLARWVVENAGLLSRHAPHPSAPAVVDAATVIDPLTAFIEWAGRRLAFAAAQDCQAVIAELRERLPRALAVGARLSAHLAGRGGAFEFPEFLTSFEDGGHGRYDRAVEPGWLEGYFRVLRVEGCLVEAEDLLTESWAWPVLFPDDVAGLLEPGLIINLELIRVGAGWQIASCGFAYPPGTEL